MQRSVPQEAAKAAIKVPLYSIEIRRTLPEDHNKHSLKWYNFWGEPQIHDILVSYSSENPKNVVQNPA